MHRTNFQPWFIALLKCITVLEISLYQLIHDVEISLELSEFSITAISGEVIKFSLPGASMCGFVHGASMCGLVYGASLCGFVHGASMCGFVHEASMCRKFHDFSWSCSLTAQYGTVQVEIRRASWIFWLKYCIVSWKDQIEINNVDVVNSSSVLYYWILQYLEESWNGSNIRCLFLRLWNRLTWSEVGSILHLVVRERTRVDRKVVVGVKLLLRKVVLQ